MGERGGVAADVACEGGAPQDIRSFDGHVVRRGEDLTGQDLGGPLTVRTAVRQDRDDHRRIDDERHRRSWSRWSRIWAADSRLPVRRVRSRACVRRIIGSGRRASSVNSDRRNS